MQKYFLLLILLLGSFLLSYKLDQLMPFIGDQGWFYISARDLVVNQNFPLVGIASSHPWLHQGAMWTYMLAIVLPLFNFDPLAGGYLSVFIGICSLLLLYKVTKDMFSEQTALIAALLFATSPLIVMHARMPYHTTPIPFFILLFLYSLWKIINKNAKWLPVSIFSLVMLYNFELATIPLWFVLFIVIALGIWKKAKWVNRLKNKNILLLSLMAFFVPMLPILIYDTQNGFPQTIKFAMWMVYKIAVIFGYPPLHPEFTSPTWSAVFVFAGEFYKRLIYIDSSLVAFTFFVFSFGFFYKRVFDQLREKKYQTNLVLLALLLTISLLAYFAARTPSEAYLPMFFPLVIILSAHILASFMRKGIQKVLVLCIILILAGGNTYMLLKNTFFVGHNGLGYSYADRLSAAKQIVAKANSRPYSLIGKGEGSKFESFTMNYQYLTWWLGNEPKHDKQKIQFTIVEEKNNIKVIQK